MTSDRLDEYFVGEAGDYLDQLRELLTGPGWPDADELLRLAMGVRGSTRMAGAEEISRVAGALEDAARAVEDGRAERSDEVLAAVRETEADLRYLVAAIHDWGVDQSDRVLRSLGRWAALMGDPVPPAISISDLLFDDAGAQVADWADTSADDLPVPPIENLLHDPDPSPSVPIGTLFYDALDETSPAVPIEALGFDEIPGAENAVPIEALGFEDAPEAPSATPIEALLFDEPIPTDHLAEPLVVPIGSLLHEENDELAAVPVESLLFEELPTVPVESILFEELPTVSVESLLQEADETLPVVPIESLLSGQIEDASPLPVGALVVEEAESGPDAEDDGSAPPFVETARESIPIESLLLRGDSAIRQALALRSAIESATHDPSPEGRALPDLVNELFELLELSLVADHPEA